MKLSHVAIRPARNMIGEQVFASRWLNLMEKDRNPASRMMLEQILVSYPYPVDQRAAAVAASFITWLGTNVGGSFLDLANEFKSVRGIYSVAYVAAWGVMNVRSFGLNSNARQIEFLTRTVAELDSNVFSEVSVRDLEVIDQVAHWLGSDLGQMFLAECAEEIARRKDLESYAVLCASGRGNSLRARQLATKLVTK